ncbi:LRR receptor-like serine threonine-protein kinase [Musa troglodytarum]|uniref:LRR receptor-like serine threonine-protein kinase n=1 Tax=Musa troglodytarum TaxID=320322 RepID=A0A9E7E7J3_9LILI|nr:LRR receptor-like serine threonine-protein kinase [Musa troglodytarum]
MDVHSCSSNGYFTSYPGNMHVFGLPQHGCGYDRSLENWSKWSVAEGICNRWESVVQLIEATTLGVPKLKGSELEAACEDFSNIVVSHQEFTVYKGTLSSGVEIAACIDVLLILEVHIDALSRVNHKHFVSLLGYCEENEPLMRMMVLEYGTLYEHLHVEEFEHLDWGARVRIIMETAYCLRHMLELKPPVPHPNLL